MPRSRLPKERGKKKFVYILLFRLRTLTDDEKHQWFKKWADIRKKMPKQVKVVTEAIGAFGTDYTGFTVFEGPLNKYEELYDLLDQHASYYVDKTMTIIGTKGGMSPSIGLEAILERRPID